MNWAQFQAAIASLNTDPVPLGSMAGVAHDNATRDIQGPPPGRAINNDYASLITSGVRGDFVWLGIGVDHVQADGSGGHPLLLGMRTGYCAGRIEDYGFFFHSGHYHPEVEHAIPFLIDFIERSCSTLAGGPRDTEVDRLSKLRLCFYRSNSATETYYTTFADLTVKYARIRAMPIGAAAAAAADTSAKGPITGYKDGPWGMKIPIYGEPPASAHGSAPSTKSSASALAMHSGLGLLTGVQLGIHSSAPPKFVPKPTIAEPPLSLLAATGPAQPAFSAAAPSSTFGAASGAAAGSAAAAAAGMAPTRPFNLGVTPQGQYFAGLRLARAIWMPDSERTSCARCHTAFTMFNRKHHCRKCGDLVCDSCSGQTRIVHRPATKPRETEVDVTADRVRVCSACVRRIDL